MINSIHTDNPITPRSLATESLAGDPSPYPSRRFSRVSRRFSTVQPDLEGQSKAEKSSKGRRCAGKLTLTRVAIGVIMVLLAAGFITFLTLYLLKDDRNKPRVAVLIRGESFREGGRFNRATSTDPQEQMELSDAHFRLLIDKLTEDHNFEVDIFSSTYATDTYEMLLTKLDQNGQLKSTVVTSKPGTQAKNMRDVLRLFNDYLTTTYLKTADYQFVVMVRHDMLLKMDLAKAVARAFKFKSGSKFLAPYKMDHVKENSQWLGQAAVKGSDGAWPTLIDTLFAYTPDMHQCLYDAMSDTAWLASMDGGNGLHRLGENKSFVECAAAHGVSELGFILPGVAAHGSSGSYWNPMYHLAGRKEAKAPTGNIGDCTNVAGYILEYKGKEIGANVIERYCADQTNPTEL